MSVRCIDPTPIPSHAAFLALPESRWRDGLTAIIGNFSVLNFYYLMVILNFPRYYVISTQEAFTCDTIDEPIKHSLVFIVSSFLMFDHFFHIKFFYELACNFSASSSILINIFVDWLLYFFIYILSTDLYYVTPLIFQAENFTATFAFNNLIHSFTVNLQYIHFLHIGSFLE